MGLLNRAFYVIPACGLAGRIACRMGGVGALAVTSDLVAANRIADCVSGLQLGGGKGSGILRRNHKLSAVVSAGLGKLVLIDSETAHWIVVGRRVRQLIWNDPPRLRGCCRDSARRTEISLEVTRKWVDRTGDVHTQLIVLRDGGQRAEQERDCEKADGSHRNPPP